MLVVAVVVLLVLEPQARVALAVAVMLEHMTALQMELMEQQTQAAAVVVEEMVLAY
jgi:hypothetical protein